MPPEYKPNALLLNPAIPPDKQFLYENIVYKRERALGYYFNILHEVAVGDTLDLVIYNVHDYLPAPQVRTDLPEIPHVCIISVDAVSQSLGHVVSYYEQHGIQAYFTAESSIWEYAPSVTAKMFHWPWGIFEDDFEDLSHAKKCDLLLTTGNYTKAYHWRERVFPVVSLMLNVKNFGHFQTSGQRVTGKAFNEVLSQARIIPTCGGYNQALVLKHLEIPAAGSLLLTEETEIVKQAGFVDGENCLFADDHNVVEKCEAILQDPERYQRIVAAGRELVLTRHEYRVRNPIYEWLRYWKQGVKQLRQETPFSPLEKGDNVRHWRYPAIMEPIVALNIDKFQTAREEDEELILYYINEYFLNYPGFIYRAGLYYLCKGQPEKSYLYFLKIYMAVQRYKDPVLLAQLALVCAALGKVRFANQIRASIMAKGIQFKSGLLASLLTGGGAGIPEQETRDYHGLFMGDLKVFTDFLSEKYGGVLRYFQNNSEYTDTPVSDKAIWDELTSASRMPLQVKWLKVKIALDRKLNQGKKYNKYQLY